MEKIWWVISKSYRLAVSFFVAVPLFMDNDDLEGLLPWVSKFCSWSHVLKKEASVFLQSDKWMKLGSLCEALGEGRSLLLLVFNAWIVGFPGAAYELTTYGVFVVEVSSLEP